MTAANLFALRCVGLTFLMLLVPQHPLRADCTDYRQHLHWVGGDDDPDWGEIVSVAGSHAYVADGWYGVKIVDVSDPSAPKSISTVSMGFVSGIASEGNRAYVASDSSLVVIDASDPASPEFEGTAAIPDRAMDVAVKEPYAYVAAAAAGLVVVDVSDPARPFVIGSVNTGRTVQAVAIAGSRAYLAGFDRLEVVDISDPSRPALLGGVAAGMANDVSVGGDYVFLCHSGGYGFPGSLGILDVSDPFAPSAIRYVWMPGHATGVKAAGDLVYVAVLQQESEVIHEPGGLVVLDVSNPEEPIVRGRAALPSFGYDVALAGDRAYVATASGLQVFELANSTLPSTVGEMAIASGPDKLAVTGSLAVVGASSDFSGDGELVLVDFSDPTRMTITGSLETGHFRDVDAVGHYAYMLVQTLREGFTKLEVVDLRIPKEPIVVGSVRVPALAMEVRGDFAYFAAGSSGFLVMDVSEPSAPTRVGGLATDHPAIDLALVGSQAYVASSQGGLLVVDLTSPASPVVVGSADVANTGTSPIRALATAAGYLYVLRADKVQVFDLAEPAHPKVVGCLETSGSAWDVEVAGSTAYIADRGLGLLLVDVADPTTPFIVGGASTLGGPTYLTVVGSQVLILDGKLRILPAQCGGETSLLSALEAHPLPGAIELRWQVRGGGLEGFLLERAPGATPGEGDYRPLNTEHPVPGRGPWEYSDPTVTAGATYSYRVVGLFPEGGRVVSEPSTATYPSIHGFALLRIFPNPVQGDAHVRFYLSERGDAKLSIHGPDGRRIRCLLDGSAAAGQGSVSWDGRDDLGRDVAAGAYFVRLTSKGREQGLRVVKTR